MVRLSEVGLPAQVESSWTHSLKETGLNPFLNLSSEDLVSEFAFKMQLAPLQRG
jgi:hypothetical protein